MTTSFGLRVRVLALGLGALAVATVAAAETRPLRGSFAGTVHDSGLDLNDDGQVASVPESSGPSSVGSAVNKGVLELNPFDGASFCGPTHLALTYRYFEGSHQMPDGSAYFTTLRAGTVCFDFTTGHYTLELTVDIVGGRGRFSGASGFLTYQIHSDKPALNGFSAFSGTFEGTLTTP
jgi:hypothetical protein